MGVSVLAERLNIAFRALGLNANSFRVKHGEGEITRATIYNALNLEKGAHSDSIRIICELEPSISAEYLLRGIGDPIKQDYEIGDTDPCAKYKDHIRKQSQQNDDVLGE